jgi:hypothetical protein
MNRITNEQREAIVREAVAKRDALLTGAPMAKMPDTIDFDIRVHGVPAGYKLVPIEPPASLAPLLTSYSLDERHGWSERDRAEIVASLRSRWAAILAALPDSLPPVSLGVVCGSPEPRPPCTVCGTPHDKHGSFPTCASHPYTADGNCQHVIGARCVGAECKVGCVRASGVGVVGTPQRKPMTDGEIYDAWDGAGSPCKLPIFATIIRATEAHHGIAAGVEGGYSESFCEQTPPPSREKGEGEK